MENYLCLVNKKSASELSSCSVVIEADTTVIQPLIERVLDAIKALPSSLFEHARDAFKLLLDSGDFFERVTCIKPNGGTTRTSNLLVTFYPSNSFLMFSRAIFTGQVDSLDIKSNGGGYE